MEMGQSGSCWVLHVGVGVGVGVAEGQRADKVHIS